MGGEGSGNGKVGAGKTRMPKPEIRINDEIRMMNDEVQFCLCRNPGNGWGEAPYYGQLAGEVREAHPTHRHSSRAGCPWYRSGWHDESSGCEGECCRRDLQLQGNQFPQEHDTGDAVLFSQAEHETETQLKVPVREAESGNQKV